MDCVEGFWVALMVMSEIQFVCGLVGGGAELGRVWLMWVVCRRCTLGFSSGVMQLDLSSVCLEFHGAFEMGDMIPGILPVMAWGLTHIRKSRFAIFHPQLRPKLEMARPQETSWERFGTSLGRYPVFRSTYKWPCQGFHLVPAVKHPHLINDGIKCDSGVQRGDE